MKIRRVLITLLAILAVGLFTACNEEVDTTKNNDLDYALLLESNGAFKYSGKKYDSLTDVLKVIEKGSHDSSEKTITLSSNAFGFSASIAENLENVVLDLGGNTITFIDVKDSAIMVGEGASLTVKNGTLTLWDKDNEDLAVVSSENAQSLTLDGVNVDAKGQKAIEAAGVEHIVIENNSALNGDVIISGTAAAPSKLSADITSSITGVIEATGEASRSPEPYDKWDVVLEIDNDVEAELKYASIHVLADGHATILNKDTSSTDNKYLATKGTGSAIFIPAGSAAVIDSGICLVDKPSGVFYYGSINEAFEDDNSNQIIRMLDHDSELLDKTLTVPYTVTINLNGWTINPADAVMTIADGAVFTVTDYSVESMAQSHFHPDVKSEIDGTSGFVVENTGAGSLTVHGSVTVSGGITAGHVVFDADSSQAALTAGLVDLQDVVFAGANAYGIEANGGNISLIGVTGTTGAICTGRTDAEAEGGVSGSITIDNSSYTSGSGKTLSTGALSASFTYGSGEGETTVYGDVEVRGGNSGNRVTVAGIPKAKDVVTAFADITGAVGSTEIGVASVTDAGSSFRNDIRVIGAAGFDDTEFAANADVRYLRSGTLAITGATFNNTTGIYDLGAESADPSETVPALSITDSTGTVKALATAAGSIKVDNTGAADSLAVSGDVSATGGDVTLEGNAGNRVTVAGIPKAKDVVTAFADITGAVGSTEVGVASVTDESSTFRNDIRVIGAAEFAGTEFAANAEVRYLRSGTLAITGATFNNTTGIYDLGAESADPSETVPALSITGSTGTVKALATAAGSIKVDNTGAAADLTVTGNVSATAGFDVTLTGADGHPIFLEGDVTGKAVALTYVTAKSNANASASFSAYYCVVGDGTGSDNVFSPAISISASKIKVDALAGSKTGETLNPATSVTVDSPVKYTADPAAPSTAGTVKTQNLTINAVSANLTVTDLSATGNVDITGGTYSGNVSISGGGVSKTDCRYTGTAFDEATIPVFKAGSTFTYNGGGSGTLLAKAGDFKGSASFGTDTNVTLDGSYVPKNPNPQTNPLSYSLRLYNIDGVSSNTTIGSAYILESDLDQLCVISKKVNQTTGYVYMNYNPASVVEPADGKTYDLGIGSAAQPANVVLNLPVTGTYGSAITNGLLVKAGRDVTLNFGSADYTLTGTVYVERGSAKYLKTSKSIASNVGSYYYDSSTPKTSNDKRVESGPTGNLYSYKFVPYTITYANVANCTYSGTTTSYWYNPAKQEYTFTATPATNYEVKSIAADKTGVTVAKVSGNSWKLTIPAGTTGDITLTADVQLMVFSITYNCDEHCSSVTYYYPSTVLPVEYLYSATEDFAFKIKVDNIDSGYGVVSFTSNISGVILEKDGLRYCNITIPKGTTGDLVVSVNTAEYKYATYNYSGPGQFYGSQTHRAYFANQPFEQTLYFDINPIQTKSENPPSNVTVSSSDVTLSSYTYSIKDGVGKGTVVLPANAPDGITITVSKQ